MNAGAEPRPLVLRRHPQAALLVRRRSALLQALRGELLAAGLAEVDAPVLLPFAGQEAHLHPPRVELAGLPGPLYLQTSPELALKRLVAGGAQAIFALGPAFRGGVEELSARHQPAFTLLEWYRPGDTPEALVADVEGLVAAAAAALELPAPSAASRVDLRELLPAVAGVSLQPLLDGDEQQFARSAATAGLRLTAAGRGARELFERVFAECIDPWLAAQRGLLAVTGWPACAAALARPDPDDARVAQRVELYLHGLELANGWVELADAREYRRRWTEERRARAAGGSSASELPWDEELLADLEAGRWRDTVGMALGVDRLWMALAGSSRLDAQLPLSLQRDAAPT